MLQVVYYFKTRRTKGTLKTNVTYKLFDFLKECLFVKVSYGYLFKNEIEA